jgi:hypothetical protein
MFDSKTNITGRVTDAVDLLIDFATLGEYGLEEVQQRPLPCEARRRNDRWQSTGAWSSAIARFAAQS